MTHIKYTYTRPAHCEILISLGEKHPRFPPPPFFPSLATRIKFCKLQQGLNNNRNLSNKIAIPPEEIIISTSAPRISRFGRPHFSRPASLVEEKKKRSCPPSKKSFGFIRKGEGRSFRAKTFFSYISVIYYTSSRDHRFVWGWRRGRGRDRKLSYCSHVLRNSLFVILGLDDDVTTM